jgi:hypothetical protein
MICKSTLWNDFVAALPNSFSSWPLMSTFLWFRWCSCK